MYFEMEKRETTFDKWNRANVVRKNTVNPVSLVRIHLCVFVCVCVSLSLVSIFTMAVATLGLLFGVWRVCVRSARCEPAKCNSKWPLFIIRECK